MSNAIYKLKSSKDNINRNEMTSGLEFFIENLEIYLHG